MKTEVYEWHCQTEGVATYVASSYSDHERALALVDTWTGQKDSAPLQFKRLGGKTTRKSLPADSMLCDVPASRLLSSRAVDLLGETLSRSGLLHPACLVDEPSEQFFIFLATKVVDCLDPDNGKIELFRDVYAFQADKVPFNSVFRLPQDSVRVFMDGQMRRRVVEAELTGFDLVELWSSTAGAYRMILVGQSVQLVRDN